MTKLITARRLWFSITLLAVICGLACDWYFGLPEDAMARYVGRDSCAQCHESEHSQWTGSDHDRAMELATDESVLGNFNDTEFSHLGKTTRFFRQGEKYFVNTDGPDGQWRDYQVKYTFGIEPLQQYMVEFPGGRLQVLRVSWDTVLKRWFYVPPPDVTDERIEGGDPMHWTGISQNWNTMCAECHSTNLQKNYHLDSNSYNTTYSEIDVSCEACHGPGSLHVELAESRSPFWDRRLGYGLARLKGKNAKAQLDSCAPCHSRRSAVHPDYHAGKDFLDHYRLSLLGPGLYHADGQILDEVYVYGSFLQSKMYGEGVRCTNCHNPHSLKLKFEGNRLCLQCHQPGKYDTPNHHHHTDVAATQCVVCHMPQHNYMVIDGRRDHSLRVPRPDLSVQLGTPNACNDCHNAAEETPAWAAEAIRRWYGEKRPDDPHYGVALAAARRGDADGLAKLGELLNHKKTPAIVRATALEMLRQYPSSEADRLCCDALGDSDPLVRAAALGSLSDEALRKRLPEIARRLSDSSRLVRSSAAQRLAASNRRLDELGFGNALEKAIEEYRQGMAIISDRAASHLQLVGLAQALGDTPAAVDSLRTAIRLEPYLSGPRQQLAQMLGNSPEDQQESRRLREEEVELLVRDSKMVPTMASPHYRRGMLLYLLDRVEESREALQEACRLEPQNYSNWLALALVCEKLQLRKETMKALVEMERLRPGNPDVRGIFQRMQQAAGEGVEP